MNDRYLYRAKRTDIWEWVEGNIVWSDDTDDDYKAIIIPTTDSNMFTRGGAGGDLGFENWCRVDPTTICQCTGLKDKNGNLIWENDIIEAHLDNLFPEDISRFHVLWKDYSFKIRLEKELYDDFCEDVSKLFEVAGNIFDNPELLEVGE